MELHHDLLCMILDALPARTLIAIVNTSWRTAVGDILRERAGALVDWKSSMHVEDQVNGIQPHNLLGHALQHATRTWRYLPTLALIFATDKTFRYLQGKSKKRAHLVEATGRLADEAGRMLPPSCTVIVIRSTGILGQTVSGAPDEVENGEDNAAVSVLLGHVPSSVSLSWLGVGRDGETSRHHGEVVLRGRVASHAGAWWLDSRHHHAVTEFQHSSIPVDARELAPDLSYTTGSRLLAVSTLPTNAISRWSDDFLLKIVRNAKLAAGGRAIATAIRSGRHTVHSVHAGDREGVRRGAPASTLQAGVPSVPGGAIAVCGLILQIGPNIPVLTCTIGEDVVGSARVEKSLSLCLGRVTGDRFTEIRDQFMDQEDPDLGGFVGYTASYSVAPDQLMFTARAALIFTCNGRGNAYHDEPNAESLALTNAVPAIPFAGFFAAGELGPHIYPKNPRDDVRHQPHPENGMHEFSCVVAIMGST
jgi:hypothetical protein